MELLLLTAGHIVQKGSHLQAIVGRSHGEKEKKAKRMMLAGDVMVTP
jgi:hypothetical protein